MRRRARSGLKKRHGGLTSGRVQVFLFPRDSWTIEDAILWSSLHGHKADDYDVKENYIRVFPHGRSKKAKRAKTIPWAISGVRAVVEWR